MPKSLKPNRKPRKAIIVADCIGVVMMGIVAVGSVCCGILDARAAVEGIKARRNG